MQTLFVRTGCDYTSFFSQIGKAPFLQYFFQYAAFITGRESKCSLADTDLEGENYKKGFLAFLWLIGTVYFKKHAIVLRHHHQQITSSSSLVQLYNSNTKTGWRTYGNMLQIGVHSIMT